LGLWLIQASQWRVLEIRKKTMNANHFNVSLDTHSLIIWLVVGAVAGFLAGTVVKGGGFGLIGDIVVGILGAFIGGWLASVFQIHVGSGIIASIVTATVGAAVLILALRLVRRGRG
jgi:uncharacterized membrane protein YeaQ/YmgE (transglycosylase-associated protein family)